MIIDTPTTQIIANSSTKSEQFTIQVSTQAFHILFDKLYSDKIGAVVREYISNTLDAHREALEANKSPSAKPFMEYYTNVKN